MIETILFRSESQNSQVLRLSGTTKQNSGAVRVLQLCRLYFFEGVAESGVINAHLNAAEYNASDESVWLIVSVESEAVCMPISNRSEVLDILASRDNHPIEIKARLVNGFESACCLSMQKSAAIKIRRSGRPYLVAEAA